MLLALARLRAIGHEDARKDLAAVFAGYPPGGSSARGAFAQLVKDGLVQYPSEGLARLTPAGAAAAPPVDAPASFDGLRETLERERLLNAKQLEAFDLIAKAHPDAIAKADVAVSLDFPVGGSSIRGILARLHALQLVSYPQEGTVRANDWIFMRGGEA